MWLAIWFKSSGRPVGRMFMHRRRHGRCTHLRTGRPPDRFDLNGRIHGVSAETPCAPFHKPLPRKRPLIRVAHVWREHLEMITAAGLASQRQMSKSPSRRFPVTVAQLPVTHCQVCHRTVAYRPGAVTEVLTEHYRRAHPETLDAASR
jgi:hypothetical protein